MCGSRDVGLCFWIPAEEEEEEDEASRGIMECYATPWPLWRESRILWHIVEPSFAFGASLSLSPSLIALSFLSLGGLMPACRPEGFCVLFFVLLERECGKNNSLKPSILLVLLV